MEKVKEWCVSSTGNHQGLVVEQETGRNVAVTYEAADAPLIAAAPDLLEALREILDECAAYFNKPAQLKKPAKQIAVRKAEDAIAKARGDY